MKTLSKTISKSILGLTLIASASAALASPQSDRLLRAYNHRSSAMARSPGEYDVRSWCDSSVRDLQRALLAFEMQVSAGHNVRGFNILKSALESLLQSTQPVANKPLVQLAAESALVVAAKLELAGLSGDPAALNTLEHLVRSTVTEAYQVDRDYYITYIYRYGHRPEAVEGGFIENMQRAAMGFAARQIDAALSSATDYEGEYRPKGNARAFLTVAEVIANNTAYDLESNIFSNEIPCTISQISDLGADLKAFNRGSRATFPSVVVAVDEAGHGLSEARSSILNLRSCE